MGIYIKNGITKRQFDSFMKQRNGLNKPVIILTLPENVMFVPDHGDLEGGQDILILEPIVFRDDITIKIGGVKHSPLAAEILKERNA